MDAEKKWKEALRRVDLGKIVNDPDTRLGVTPERALMNLKNVLQDLMQWTASTWLNHAEDTTACNRCRGFYVSLSRISEQLFYARRWYDQNEIGKFYHERRNN